MLNPEALAMVKRTSNHQCMLAIAVLSTAVAPIRARADPLHVRDSVPAFEGVIRGRHAQYVIRFNGLIDHSSSLIEITQSGRVVQSFLRFCAQRPFRFRWSARPRSLHTSLAGKISRRRDDFERRVRFLVKTLLDTR